MTTARSASFTFPQLSWWRQIRQCEAVVLEEQAPFRKMTARNRYRIATANGPLLLTIPITGGRTLKTPVGEVLIDYRQDWQKQHWRTLFSAYGRAPFFEHYGPALERLLMQRYERLAEFNYAALEWIGRELRLPVVFLQQGDAPLPDALIDEAAGLPDAPAYTQVFADRHGFLPGLSILDLLMNEGPAALGFLR